jgi:hypothetical protein
MVVGFRRWVKENFLGFMGGHRGKSERNKLSQRRDTIIDKRFQK